jgi:2-polyprenyl-6-methoxyphenol hydroxylase-like FAD-dependent oxidoreductase
MFRAGYEVTVFERSSGELKSRGAGIATTPGVLAEMVADDLIDETFPGCPTSRITYVCQGDGDHAGRWLGDAPGGVIRHFNWAHLFDNLRRRVPANVYRDGVTVEQVDASESNRAMLRTSDGRTESFDLIVCADGYQSLGRAIVAPGSPLSYRRMVAWRGILPEPAVPVIDLTATIRAMFQGGYGVVYPIPGADGATEPGRRLLTWVFFLQVAPDDLDGLLLDVDGRQQSGSVAFGKVRPAVSDEFRQKMATALPPAVLEIIDASPDYSIQAIYSTVLPTYHRNRLCLVGDAGSVLPPFTGSGVLKAVGNARSLTDTLGTATSLDEALGSWSEAQCELAEPAVKVAEHNERALVFDCPDLSGMTVEETNTWMLLTSKLYAASALNLPNA